MMRTALTTGVICALAACSQSWPSDPPGAGAQIRIGADGAAQGLWVEIPQMDAAARLVPAGDSQSVTTWRAPDDVTIALDDGVLVATRGLGFDLMGADISATRAALRDEGAQGYMRRMRYLDGANDDVMRRFECFMDDVPAEDGARAMRERCAGLGADSGLAFTNLYVLDAQGDVLRSRQWVSPEIGMLTIAPAPGNGA